jgi:dimeric dUTPase (all-alpha-NTP-PPase superfamily)
MNFKKLFETQQLLRNRIDYNETDRFEKLLLALQVELGECANEWRGFKFWSKDQEPRIKGDWVRHTGIKNGEFVDVYKNPLLEEYVDGLHFVLEVGIELEMQDEPVMYTTEHSNVTSQFNYLFYTIGEMYDVFTRADDREELMAIYDDVSSCYLGLGKILGFTEEQIQEAYFEKNKVNHQRQESGY